MLPQQALLEFVAAVTRRNALPDGSPLLEQADAVQEAESLARQFPVLYPDEVVLRTAIRGRATYHLPWFDAHLWAFAEAFGLPEILSDDFQHGRHYGSVRVRNPFAVASGEVRELAPLYSTP